MGVSKRFQSLALRLFVLLFAKLFFPKWFCGIKWICCINTHMMRVTCAICITVTCEKFLSPPCRCQWTNPKGLVSWIQPSDMLHTLGPFFFFLAHPAFQNSLAFVVTELTLAYPRFSAYLQWLYWEELLHVTCNTYWFLLSLMVESFDLEYQCLNVCPRNPQRN